MRQKPEQYGSAVQEEGILGTQQIRTKASVDDQQPARTVSGKDRNTTKPFKINSRPVAARKLSLEAEHKVVSSNNCQRNSAVKDIIKSIPKIDFSKIRSIENSPKAEKQLQTNVQQSNYQKLSSRFTRQKEKAAKQIGQYQNLKSAEHSTKECTYCQNPTASILSSPHSKANLRSRLSVGSSPKFSSHSLIQKNLNQKYSYMHKEFNNCKVVNDLIYNEGTHLVCIFKDYLILDDINEFLKRFYMTPSETKVRLPKLCDFYEKYSQVFPNYVALPESKYMFKNIQKKQKLIDADYQRQNGGKTNMSLQEDERLFSQRFIDSVLNKHNNFSLVKQDTLIEGAGDSNVLDTGNSVEIQINKGDIDLALKNSIQAQSKNQQSYRPVLSGSMNLTKSIYEDNARKVKHSRIQSNLSSQLYVEQQTQSMHELVDKFLVKDTEESFRMNNTSMGQLGADILGETFNFEDCREQDMSAFISEKIATSQEDTSKSSSVGKTADSSKNSTSQKRASKKGGRPTAYIPGQTNKKTPVSTFGKKDLERLLQAGKAPTISSVNMNKVRERQKAPSAAKTSKVKSKMASPDKSPNSRSKNRRNNYLEQFALNKDVLNLIEADNHHPFAETKPASHYYKVKPQQQASSQAKPKQMKTSPKLSPMATKRGKISQTPVEQQEPQFSKAAFNILPNPSLRSVTSQKSLETVPCTAALRSSTKMFDKKRGSLVVPNLDTKPLQPQQQRLKTAVSTQNLRDALIQHRQLKATTPNIQQSSANSSQVGRQSCKKKLLFKEEEVADEEQYNQIIVELTEQSEYVNTKRRRGSSDELDDEDEAMTLRSDDESYADDRKNHADKLLCPSSMIPTANTRSRLPNTGSTLTNPLDSAPAQLRAHMDTYLSVERPYAKTLVPTHPEHFGGRKTALAQAGPGSLMSVVGNSVIGGVANRPNSNLLQPRSTLSTRNQETGFFDKKKQLEATKMLGAKVLRKGMVSPTSSTGDMAGVGVSQNQQKKSNKDAIRQMSKKTALMMAKPSMIKQALSQSPSNKQFYALTQPNSVEKRRDPILDHPGSNNGTPYFQDKISSTGGKINQIMSNSPTNLNEQLSTIKRNLQDTIQRTQQEKVAGGVGSINSVRVLSPSYSISSMQKLLLPQQSTKMNSSGSSGSLQNSQERNRKTIENRQQMRSQKSLKNLVLPKQTSTKTPQGTSSLLSTQQYYISSVTTPGNSHMASRIQSRKSSNQSAGKQGAVASKSRFSSNQAGPSTLMQQKKSPTGYFPHAHPISAHLNLLSVKESSKANTKKKTAATEKGTMQAVMNPRSHQLLSTKNSSSTSNLRGGISSNIIGKPTNLLRNISPTPNLNGFNF